MIKKIINKSLVIILLLIIAQTNAQTNNVDSLEHLLKTRLINDTVKVNLLNDIAIRVHTTDSGKTFKYINQAIDISNKLSYTSGKAESMWVKGVALAYYNSFKVALDYFLYSVKLSDSINNKHGLLKYNLATAHTYSSLGNIDKAVEYLEKSKILAQQLNNLNAMSNCLFSLSKINTGLGNYNIAIQGYEKVIAICDSINDKLTLAKVYNNMGEIQKFKGNFPKAFDYYLKSLKINETIQNNTGIIMGYLNIGTIMMGQNNDSLAFQYYNNALKIAEKLNDKKLLLYCYEHLGDANSKNDFSKGLGYLQKALKLSEQMNYMPLTLNVSKKIAALYGTHGNYDKAMEYYLKALSIAQSVNRKRVVCEIWYKMSLLYHNQNNNSKALYYANNSLTIADELNLLSFKKDIHLLLANIYSETGNYKNAFFNYKLFKEINDSINSDENIKKITELEYTYKFEKEKQAIELEQQKKDAVKLAEIKQQKIIIIFSISAFLLMTLLTVYIYRSYSIKKRSNILLTHQKNEIENKNTELIHLNKEILAQKEEITAISNEIECQNIELQKLNATKDKFFSIIAHDLRNPFNVILGYSKLLGTLVLQNNQVQILKYINMLQNAAQNAYKLLENLLEWSRAQTGSIEFAPHQFNICDSIDESIKICKQLATNKNITINYNSPGSCIVYADSNMINTVIRNLITNAIKFTHKGGSILISCSFNNYSTIVSVLDTGIGMDEKTKDKLFKINEKVSVPGTEQERGTGLGLLLSKEFVEKHGGIIWVETEPDKGSNFKFTIPNKT